MAEIVNLRQMRKRQQRADKERQAAANRTKYGRTKAEKQREAAETGHGQVSTHPAKRIPQSAFGLNCPVLGLERDAISTLTAFLCVEPDGPRLFRAFRLPLVLLDADAGSPSASHHA